MKNVKKIEPTFKNYIWGTEAWYELFPDCPILLKTIEANEPLSVQVHPDDEYARRVENQSGKTEMWYITDAEPGAGIYYGFNRELTKIELKNRMQNNTLTEVLNFVKVKPGDVFLVEAGTVHAIGKGMTITEIQQNSNLTYRLYDYGRIGQDGKPRELHIEKALDVVIRKPAQKKEYKQTQTTLRNIAESKYFNVTEYRIGQQRKFFSGNESFHALFFLNGSGAIIHADKEHIYHKGEVFFIPAGLGNYIVAPEKETLLLLIGL